MKKSILSSVLGIASFVLLLSVSPTAKVEASMPYNFVGSPGGSAGTVNLSWTDYNSSANSYNLMYGTVPGVYTYGALALGEGPSGNTNFTVGALVPGMTYYFVLNAFQGSTYVATSGPIAVSAAGGTVALAPTAMAAPVGVPSVNPWAINPTFGFWATKGTQSGTVQLSWTDPTNLANTYAVMYGAAPGQNTWGALGIAEGAGGNTAFTVGALVPGQTYYFTLVAWQGGTFVKVSNPVAAVAR